MQSSTESWKQSVVIAVGVALLNQGCSATNLGWYPASVRVDVTEAGEQQYRAVRNFAYQVADGYDTRRTTNRYAWYAGALIAGAAAGAVAGLAAFDTGNSAIIGIPIGTTFLGGALTLYQNEKKAAIYELGHNQVMQLIQQSNDRTARFKTVRVNGDPELERLEKELQTARQALAAAKKHAAEVRKTVVGSKKAAAAAASADDPAVAEALLDAADQAANKMTADAKAKVAQAQARVDALERKAANLDLLLDLPATAALDQWQMVEAQCLNRDVTATMSRVDRQLRLLDPANVDERLANLKAEVAKYPTPPATEAAGTAAGAGGAKPAAAPTPTPTPAPAAADTFGDLTAPAVSSCLEHDI